MREKFHALEYYERLMEETSQQIYTLREQRANTSWLNFIDFFKLSLRLRKLEKVLENLGQEKVELEAKNQ